MKTHEQMMGYRIGKQLNYTKLHCCFNEIKGEYDLKNPHVHTITESYYLKAPHYIFDGIAVKTEVGWKYGVNEKYLEYNEKRAVYKSCPLKGDMNRLS